MATCKNNTNSLVCQVLQKYRIHPCTRRTLLPVFEWIGVWFCIVFPLHRLHVEVPTAAAAPRSQLTSGKKVSMRHPESSLNFLSVVRLSSQVSEDEADECELCWVCAIGGSAHRNVSLQDGAPVQLGGPVGSRVGGLWGAGSGSCGVQGRGPVGFRVGVHGGFVVALRLGGLIFESQRF